MEFFEAPAFTRRLAGYLDEEQYRALQNVLAEHPEAGDLIPGSGGFRKLRWRDQRRGKGSRGGLRVVYFWFPHDDQIWLMTLYDKNEASDLTPTQKRTLKEAIDAETEAREKRRRR